MYHRSDSCIQLGVMNLVSTFEQHDGFGMFRSPIGNPRISLMSYKMLVLHHLISCKLHLTSDDMFFFVMKKISVNPEIIHNRLSPLRRLVHLLMTPFTEPREHHPGSILPRWDNSIFTRFVMHKAFKTVQDWVQNIQRSTTGWWLTYPSEKSWSSSVGVIIPNIWVCLKIVYP